MKITRFLTLAILLISFVSSAQEDKSTCVCDTTFKKLAPGTLRKDSINWVSVECYYWRKRMKGEPKSTVNYQNGVRHGEFITYHRKAYWVFVKQRGYQQAVPRRRRKVRDFYRKEGKSLFGRSESGTYANGMKDGVWHKFDTNQRIVSSITWKEGVELQPGQTCKGIYDTYGFDYRKAFDSIMKNVGDSPENQYHYKEDGKTAITYHTSDLQLNGEMKIYKKAKKPYLRTQFFFEDNCLSGQSVTFSMNGDTTRIESDYRNGVAYKIVSYTPASRGTAYYRDPRNSYELNSEYRNGLVIERREKSPRKK
ncbi:MAG: antitoxin component YwqK of YwqJK toxin-antitoxin module [Crocinitomicaceae bacterium]|jgi:antitoxin component YwqK of YwqJK toxin-antitoxin module